MKKLFTLILLFTVLALQAQYTCETAVTASIGTNTIPATDSSEYWFSYTMAGDNKLLINSDNCASIYLQNCNRYINYECNTFTLTEGSAGEEVLIGWDTWAGGDFTWTLTEEAIEIGEKCSYRDTAYEGTNTLPATTVNEYWYEFTMPRDGKLIVATAADVDVAIQNDYCSSWPDDLSAGYQHASSDRIGAGERVFIRFYIWGTSNFDWNITIESFEDGDNCFNAIPATIGNNLFPASTNSEYWYKFTMPAEGGELNIDALEINQVLIYDACWSPFPRASTFNSNLSVNFLEPGKEYYIKIITISSSDFNWNLTVTPIEEGASCYAPAIAIEGSNILPETDNNYYWYSYTMPHDGKLVITSSVDKMVHIRKGSCINPYHLGGNIQNTAAINLSQGDEVVILWHTSSGGDFTWNLSAEAMVSGDNCELAAGATTGTNTVPATYSIFWNKFTVPHNNKAIISCPSNAYRYVHAGTCEMPYTVSGGSATSIISEFPFGNELLIEWEANGGDFTWDLQFEPLETGDNCELAASAQLGTNTLIADDHLQYWYSFTMPSTGNLVISSSAGINVGITQGTCSDRSYLGASRNSNITTTSMMAGDEIFIYWNVNGQNVNFDWDLSIETQVTGDNCTLAAAALEGKNTVPATDHQSYWYSFTMPRSGNLVATSTADENITIYDGTCSEMKTILGGMNYAAAADLETGDEVFISVGTYNGGNVDWNLSINDPIAGDDCENAIPIALGANLIDHSSIITQWLSFTMPYEARFQCYSYEALAFNALIGTCDAYSYFDYGFYAMDTEAIAAGEDILISVTKNNMGSTTMYVQLQREQSITFPPISNQDLDNDSVLLEATVSSNLDLAYRVIEGPVTLDSNIVYFNATGKVTIEAYQNGNDTIAAAIPVQQSFNITNINSLEQALLPELILYPNPVQESFYLNTGEGQPEQMALYTPDGRLVQQLNPAENHFVVSNLKPGMYVLQVQVNQSRFSYRILKQ